MLAGRRDFAEIVAAEGWSLAAGELQFAGRWLTPPMGPMRFDNRFFLLHWPAEIGLEPEVVPGELVGGEWIEPRLALEQWQQGEAVAAPPIVHLLRVLGEVGPSRAEARLVDSREADIGPMRRIELRPGVLLMPLRTPTLPPAAFTNCFLLGKNKLVLVDLATPYPDEQQALLAALDAVVAAGGEIAAIWLTHHHADHIGAVELCRRHLGVPVLAHPATAERLAPLGIAVDQHLEDGATIELGSTDRSVPGAGGAHPRPHPRPPVVLRRKVRLAAHRRPDVHPLDHRHRSARRRHGRLPGVARKGRASSGPRPSSPATARWC